MTKEEWAICDSAPDMLTALNQRNPSHFKTLIPSLHRYFLACCRKIEFLTPQKHLREGVRGAERWIEGLISDFELNRLNWHAEGEAFALDYVKTSEFFEELKNLIDGIEALDDLSFEESRILLKKAAYFTEISMIYPKINHAPFVKSLCTSEFLCADLLREYVQPEFGSVSGLLVAQGPD
jgi:hypothetical protein